MSGNFSNFGQGKPGKVRENHSLQVLTTMIRELKEYQESETVQIVLGGEPSPTGPYSLSVG